MYVTLFLTSELPENIAKNEKNCIRSKIVKKN